MLLSRFLVLLFVFSSSCIFCADNPGNTLVVFSNRNDVRMKIHTLEVLWNENTRDLRYDSNVVTLDREVAKSAGPHIVADVSKPLTHIDPTLLAGIKTIYCERPHTIPEDGAHFNIIGQYVKNLLPLLPAHEDLIIEWHPELSWESYVSNFDVDGTMLKRLLDQPNEENPFAGAFYRPHCLLATYYAISEGSAKETMLCNIKDEKVQDNIRKMAAHVNECINFYVSNNVAPREALCKKLHLETDLLWCAEEYKTEDIYVKRNTYAKPTDFNRYVTDMRIKIRDNHVIVLRLPLENNQKSPEKQPKAKMTMLSQYQKFLLNETIFYCIWSDMTVLQNKDRVIAYLEAHGLHNVTIKRDKSSVNGRENVWLVTGKKN